MKIKYFFIFGCLLISFLLCACSEYSNKDVQEKDTRDNLLGTEYEETVTEDKSTSTQKSNVCARVQIYEGCYFDESVYRYADMPESESPLVYCEIMISNITDTSFDFTVCEKTMATDESRIIVPTSTAVFIGDGTEAAYYGDEQTFNFIFPDNQESYPVIKYMEVSGFEPLEGKIYMNNAIPGHESG